MKVIYKKHIFDVLCDVITEAKTLNKKIEKFILTQEEYDEFSAYLIKSLKLSGMYYEFEPIDDLTNKFDGILIEIEIKENE